MLDLAVLLAAGMSVAGCSSANIADNLPAATGGLPQNAPQRPSMPGTYPAVHDMPPARSSVVLTEDEQKKLEEDLIAARKRTAPAGKPAGGTRNK